MHPAEFRLLAPKIPKPRRRQLSVTNRVLNIPVPEISLQSPGVVPLVGQRVATGVPQHVRMRLEGQLSLPTCTLDHAGKSCGTEGCPAL